MYTELALFIDGKWLNGAGRKGEDVVNPATGKVLAKLPHASKADLDAALEALMVELGRHEAHDLLDKAWEPIEEIVDRMNAIEPTTVAGLQAKAKLLLDDLEKL